MGGSLTRRKILTIVGLVMFIVLVAAAASRTVGAGIGIAAPSWRRDLPSGQCFGTNSPNCHSASPVLADIDNDKASDIVLATNNGHIVVFRNDGVQLWDTDIAPYFNMAPGTHEIHSSPAVEDIDRDGFLLHIIIATDASITAQSIPGIIPAMNRWPRDTSDNTA